MIELAYKKYLQLPLADTTSDSCEIYDKNWCVLTGLAFMHPHPHRYFTLDEFQTKYIEDAEFRKRFSVPYEE
jgi:hypothetical protein